MDDTQIVDIWTLFKEYVDKKHIEQGDFNWQMTELINGSD